MLFEQEEPNEEKAAISMKKWRGFLELGIDGKIIVTENYSKYSQCPWLKKYTKYSWKGIRAIIKDIKRHITKL